MSFKMTASTIAALELPGMPKTKVGVRTLAEREGWPYEEMTGVGGKRRVYVVPERLHPAIEQHIADTVGEPPQPAIARDTPVIGNVVAGSSKVDTVKLELAIRALTEWEVEKGVKVSHERRPAVIAILYDYLQNAPELAEGEKAMAVVLRALG